MQTRAVDARRVLTLAFLVFAIGREAAQPSKAASESSDRVPLKKVAIEAVLPRCRSWRRNAPRIDE